MPVIETNDRAPPVSKTKTSDAPTTAHFISPRGDLLRHCHNYYNDLTCSDGWVLLLFPGFDSMFSVEGVAVGVATTSSQIKLQFARIISGPAKSLASCPVQTPTEFSSQPLPGPHWSMLRLQLMLPPCGRGLCKTLPGHICLETPGLSGTKHLIQVTTKCWSAELLSLHPCVQETADLMVWWQNQPLTCNWESRSTPSLTESHTLSF